ncbi:MAG: hypothetical protein AB8B96_03955 [Lysobacterales bacterium]
MFNSTITASAALLLGGMIFQTTSLADEHKRTRWYCDTQPVVNFWEEQITGVAMTGRASLCGKDNQLWSGMLVDGLLPGGAYTVWWVYIDNPAACVNFPLTVETAEIPFDEPVGYAGACGLADFFTPDESEQFLNPLVVFGRMDGAQTPENGSNRFNGQFRDFTPAPGSQVWLFAFGHGPAEDTDLRLRARQLLTPEDPLSGVPHVGIEGRRNGYPAGVAVFNIP